MEIKSNTGFNGRTFLTEYEWNTYQKCLPETLIRKMKYPLSCECSTNVDGESSSNFKKSHKIKFNMGIIQLGLTPDFLDASLNVNVSHKNRIHPPILQKINLKDAIEILINEYKIDELPEYLPINIRKLFEDIKTGMSKL
jgi:hypothetical protein